MCLTERLSETLHVEFVERLITMIRAKAGALCDLLRREPWDLFLTVFKEPHCAGHQLWDSPHDGRLLQVYQALDAAIGEVLVAAGPESDVVVFSNLGMGPNLTCDHLLDRILLRLDRSRLLSLFGYVPPRSEARYHCFLRPYRTAFQVEHNEGSGAVRVNLRGRDPRGCVAPGQPMERLLDRLTDDLMALVNPNSGKPIVSRVLRTDQLYPGERRDRLPDMFVLWNRSEAASTAVSRRVGTVFAPPPRWRPGNHRSHGFFFAAGPSVKSRGPVESARIEDVAPSICHLLGVKLQDVDGRRIPSIGD
jgi:predicted AlkP superfamily phosphohydrolase/phosphomutase